ncbi:MAG: hypothetical protein FWD56_05890, partial [Bacteroidales bacterium]|nr:hypothetical protein [Bacteroidales bacterium]
MKKLPLILFLLISGALFAQNSSSRYEHKLQSPNSRHQIVVNIVPQNGATQLVWSVLSDGEALLTPSPISLSLQNGEVLGVNARISNVKRESGT